MQNNLTAGEFFLDNLKRSEGSNGILFVDNLASNPLDNPLDAGYERDKAIIDNQGPIDSLDIYQPPDPALDLDPLTGIPGFHRVSVPYADPWLVADANVPINVNQGSDQHGGGANLNQPVPLEGPSDYQNRFKKAFPSGSPEAIEAETRADQLMNPHLWAT